MLILLTKVLFFDKITKLNIRRVVRVVEGAALEMLCGETHLGFESLTLRQKKTYALIQSIGLFQRNKSLAGFVKYASRVKYCFAM